MKVIQITVHQGIKMADMIETASSLHTGALLASDAHTATPPQRMGWNVTLESSGDASFCIGDNAESWDSPVAQTSKTPTPEGISNGISSDSDSSALAVMAFPNAITMLYDLVASNDVFWPFDDIGANTVSRQPKGISNGIPSDSSTLAMAASPNASTYYDLVASNDGFWPFNDRGTTKVVTNVDEGEER
jgi:hypothetical protein